MDHRSDNAGSLTARPLGETTGFLFSFIHVMCQNLIGETNGREVICPFLKFPILALIITVLLKVTTKLVLKIANGNGMVKSNSSYFAF